MPPFSPIKRSDLIGYLRMLGFTGPEPAGRHLYMQRGGRKVGLPSPHQSDISAGLLTTILRQAGVDRATWERL
jgi:predicted RNA binding protein YcfA (HicA-like mRNA interferase family)